MSTDVLAWQRSSMCSNAGCVEVAIQENRVLVRDSKNNSSPVLSYTRDEWRSFIGGVRNGEFDLPASPR